MNSTITSLGSSLQGPSDINQTTKFKLLSPAVGQTIATFQKFAGTCDTGSPITISYSIDSNSGASGPSSTPCLDDSTFNVGIQFFGNTPNIRSVSFAQAGIAIQPDNIPITTTGLNQGGGFDNNIIAAVYDSNSGKVYVAGSFTYFQQYAVRYLARLNSDGTLDTDFIGPNGGFDADVNALVLDKVNSKLYVGGLFKEFTNKGSTVAQNYITRLNLDGTVDETFIPSGSGFNSQVNAFVLDSTNSLLYVGGSFTSHTKSATTTLQNYITRLNLTGSVDTTFIPSANGFNGAVNALARDSATGKLFAGGAFSTYLNGSTSTNVVRLAAIQSNGLIDTFVPSGGGANNIVYSLAWDATLQKLYVAGAFTTYTGLAAVSQNRLTRLNSNGTVDTSFLGSGNGFNSTISTVVLDSYVAGNIYVSGSFTSYSKSGTTSLNSLVRLTSTGAIDTAFISAGSGFDTGVRAIAINETNGDVYAGGSFISYTKGTSTTRGHFARVSAAGVIDTNYLVTNASGFSNATYIAQADPISRKIYVGGYFTKHSRANTSVTQNYLARLNNDGSLDTTFLNNGAGFNGPINAIHIDNTNNKIYVGGNFTNFTNNSGTTVTINYLCRLNTDGSLDTTFIPVGAGFNGGVSTLAVDLTAGKIYAGGTFTSYTNSSATTQNRIARLNLDGTIDTSFIPAGAGFDGSVTTLAFDSATGDLYAGGNFTSFTNGTTASQYRVTRLNSSGQVSTSFLSSGAGVTTGAVNQIILDKTLGKLYVGGNFSVFTTSAGSPVTQNSILRLSLSGELDTVFVPPGAGLSHYVNGMAVDTVTHQVYVCGGFTSHTQTTTVKQKYVTRLNSDGSVDTKFIAVNGGFNVQSNKCTLDKANNRFYVAGNANSFNGVVIGVGVGVLDLSGSLAP